MGWELEKESVLAGMGSPDAGDRGRARETIPLDEAGDVVWEGGGMGWTFEEQVTDDVATVSDSKRPGW